MKPGILLLASVLVGSIGCASSQPASRQSNMPQPVKGSVQFKPSGQQMIVEALVNGQAKVNFLVDTGASLTMIPSTAARELGINLNARLPTISVQTVSTLIQVPLVVLDSVNVGGMEVKNLTVAVHDIPFFDIYLAGPPGLLGRDFLGNFRVQVDLNQGFLLLEDKAAKSN